MNNKFSCVAIYHEDEFLWCVFEHATDQVIKTFRFEEDAKKYIRFVENGGAFDGFTPKFVTEPVKLPRNDDTFLAMTE